MIINGSNISSIYTPMEPLFLFHASEEREKKRSLLGGKIKKEKGKKKEANLRHELG